MIEVIPIRTFDDADVRNAWQRLQEGNGCDNIHFTREWLSIWWKHFGGDCKLLLLLVKDNGEAIGLVPLMEMVSGPPGFKARRIEFVATGASDYQDFLISRKKPEVIRAVFEFLSGYPWDIIRLRQLPEESPNLPYLRETIREYSRRWKMSDKVVVECPYLPLNGVEWNDYFRSLSKSQRDDIKRNIKLLGRQGVLRFEKLGPVDSRLSEVLQAIFAIHQERWDAKRERCTFPLTSEKNQAYLSEITKVFGERGWLAPYILMLDEEMISYIFCFAYNNTMYDWNTAYRPKYHRHSVGKILHRYVIEDLIKNGYDEFDFMRGAEPYKMRFTKQTRSNIEITIVRRRVSSFLTGLYYQKVKPPLEQSQWFNRIYGLKIWNFLLKK